jgi:hypothetical protein
LLSLRKVSLSQLATLKPDLRTNDMEEATSAQTGRIALAEYDLPLICRARFALRWLAQLGK